MRRLAPEHGWSLFELLLTMTLMLVVIGVAAAGLVSLTRDSDGSQFRTSSQAQNRVGIERLTRLLRQATYPTTTGASGGTKVTDSTIVTTAGPTKLVFTSRLGGSSTIDQYTFELVDGSLMYGRSACTGNPCTYAVPSESPLITNVTNQSGGGPCATQGAPTDGKVFRYYSPDSASGQLIEITPDATQLAKVDSVRISLWTRETRADVTHTCEPLSARVNLRNLLVSS